MTPAAPLFRRGLTQLGTLLLALLLVACSGERERRAVLEGYRELAHATFSDSLDAADALYRAVDTLAAQPSEQTLQAAREAWLHSRIPYSQTEALRFGNWVVDEWEAKVNSWPIDEGLIDYVDASYVASDTNPWGRANLIGSDSLTVSGRDVPLPAISRQQLLVLQALSDVESNVLTGFHALEFLLWGQDVNRFGPGAGARPWSDFALDAEHCSNGSQPAASVAPCRKRREYLRTVALLLREHLQEMRQHWRGGEGSYGSRLVAGDVNAGLRQLLFGLVSLSAEELAGERMQVALLTHAPEEEQDCFSDDTHNSLWFNGLGIENFYYGRYRRSDGSQLAVPSLAVLVASRDAALAAQLDAAFARTREALAALRQRGEGGERFDQLIAPGNAEGAALIEAAIAALRAQAALLEAAGEALALGALNPARSEA